MTSALASDASEADLFLPFPEGFRWCVAVSAHQHEGDNVHSDWWRWEQARDDRPRSLRAANHWELLEEDLDRAVAVAANTFRFNLEWARIEPREGHWDEEAVQHYRDELRALKARGLSPLVSLHQLTLPAWFADRGGFTWEGAPEAFARYAQFAVEQIGPEVVDWTTSVDILVHVGAGYVMAMTPPGVGGDVAAARAPMLGFLRAHAAAYHAMKAARRDRVPVRVGIVHYIRVYEPACPLDPVDVGAVAVLDLFSSWILSDAIASGRLTARIPGVAWIDEEIAGLRGTQDFIGINYFTRDVIDATLFGEGSFNERVRAEIEIDPARWEHHPEGLYEVLHEAHRRYPGVPLIVTENGRVAGDEDERIAHLNDHLAVIHRALRDGVPVEGYCYWSLLDSFEWVSGTRPRFGLYEVDFKTFARRRRRTADAFKRIAIENGVWRAASPAP